jgi:methylated-DNA-[protein]-cysteine S-methyltransferase
VQVDLTGGLIDTKGIAILRHSSLYAAGIFTSEGLYATSLPRSSEQSAIASVNGEGFKRSTESQHLEVLSIVHSIFKGDIINTKEIRFDFSDLTESTIKVLKTVFSIPRGETLTYGQVAVQSGLPNAARYVGTVMAGNRYAPLIPCHRVVAATSLGGFSGGDEYDIETKKSLLLQEGAKIAKK